MNGFQYYILGFKKYAQFNGRSTRKEFFYWVVFGALVSIVLDLILSELSIVYALIAFIPGLAALVRRLHDIGTSGANVLWIFLPLFGFIYLLVLVSRKSQEGDNEYGPHPLGQPAAATSVSASSEVPQNSEQH